MLRAEVVTDAARRARASERIRVRLGELKISCGADVVFETEPLDEAFAVAVFDRTAHVGGIMATASRRGGEPPVDPAQRPFLDVALALPVLIDSIVRMGGDRHRLEFAAAGDVGFLSLISTALGPWAKGAGPRRRRTGSKRSVLVLDLGSGQAGVEEAAGQP